MALTRAEIQRLLERLADGDRSALAPAFHALWPVVRRFSARMLGNEADADDVTQDVLSSVFGRVSELDPTRDALAWVLTIARYQCLSHRAWRRRRRETYGQDVAEPLSADDPEASALAKESWDAVREALGDLSALDAATLRDAFADETTRARGATFRKRLQRAMARLRVSFGRRHGTG